MLIGFKYLDHEWLTISAQLDTTSSKLYTLDMLEVSTLENKAMTSLMNSTSSTLSLMIVCLQMLMCLSAIGMMIIKGT